MEYINDINIVEAVLHVLDSNADEPVLNEYKLDLGDNVYQFIYKHIEKALKSEELKYAKFKDEVNLVKEISQEYLYGENKDIVNISQEIARQLFAIMKSNCNIPSCDLIVAYISTDQGHMLALLKMDYVKNFAHKVDFLENKIGIGIIQQNGGLPASSKKIDKAAFIKPINKDKSFNLMIIDKQKSTSEEDYGHNYFINHFLGCTPIKNERDMTKEFMEKSELFIRSSMLSDPAEKLRSIIKTKLKEEDEINISELSEELFEDESEAKKTFDAFMKDMGIDKEIVIDKKYVEKKLRKLKLKIDGDIELIINEDAYNDKSKFEIVRNGDETINLVIKNVARYIEK